MTQLCITATGFIIKQGEETLSENGSYTYTTGTSTTFTFTPTVTGNHTILFSGEGDNLTGAYKEIAVTVAEQAPKEIVIWGDGDGEGSYTFSNQGSWSLLGAGGSGGALASYKDSFEADVTLKVAFTTTSDGYPLTLHTNWSRERDFVEEYTFDENYKYLIYTFKEVDFGGASGTNDVTNAGLLLAVGDATVTITKISIIPAQTQQ